MKLKEGPFEGLQRLIELWPTSMMGGPLGDSAVAKKTPSSASEASSTS